MSTDIRFSVDAEAVLGVLDGNAEASNPGCDFAYAGIAISDHAP